MTYCRNPVINLVAWADRDDKFVFVAVPTERGRYVRTHPCVVHVPCPHCKSPTGAPCKGRHGVYWCGTHADRRVLFHATVRPDQRNVRDLVEPADGASASVKTQTGKAP